MTTAEWEDKAKAIIKDYCGDMAIVAALAPYYANIIREFDDSDQIIMRGMINSALDYENISSSIK